MGVCVCMLKRDRERKGEREKDGVTDGVVGKRNDTLQWSREGQKHSLIDNWIIMYSIIMLLCACLKILFFSAYFRAA